MASHTADSPEAHVDDGHPVTDEDYDAEAELEDEDEGDGLEHALTVEKGRPGQVPGGELARDDTGIDTTGCNKEQTAACLQDLAAEPSPETTEHLSLGDSRYLVPPGRRKPVNIAFLPCEILMLIVSKVKKKIELAAMASTCSSLNAVVIPTLYSRFEYTWPTKFTKRMRINQVDALGQCLSTLAMGEDVFQGEPAFYQSGSCPRCGEGGHQRFIAPPQTNVERQVRRGNYFARYTRSFFIENHFALESKFDVIHSEGKMLNALVALAVARMVNLESFVWDMPTGVSRDVWIALGSLANLQDHECRLERVWVRWHDNMANHDSAVSILTQEILPFPISFSTPNLPFATKQQMRLEWGPVEYPTFSVLPALKSLSVLKIDEPSYVVEMAVLINRSRDRLRELRVSLDLRTLHLTWTKPARRGLSDINRPPGWPKYGGILGVLFRAFRGSSKWGSSRCAGPRPPTQQGPGLSQSEVVPVTTVGKTPKGRRRFSDASSFSEVGSRSTLILDVLELENIHLSISIMLKVLDWTKLTTLTILRCEKSDKLWETLQKKFAPPMRPSTADSTHRYPLKLRSIRVDTITEPFLSFIDHTLAPDTLESVSLHEWYPTDMKIDDFFWRVIGRHQRTLKRVLVDVPETHVVESNWQKWVLTRDIISSITDGQMTQLRELSISLNASDWQFFVQKLPGLPNLRALHVLHIVGDDPENFERVVQILDIIAKRRYLPLAYIGILMNCYEIIDVRKDLMPHPQDVFVHTSRTNGQSDDDSLESNDSLDNLAHEHHDGELPLVPQRPGPWQLDNGSRYTFYINLVPFPENKYPIFKLWRVAL